MLNSKKTPINKTKLKEQIQGIIRDNFTYKPLDVETTNWLIENVFKFHPEWDWYVQLGNIDCVKLEHNRTNYNTVCFYLYYPGGIKTSISYMKCLKNM